MDSVLRSTSGNIAASRSSFTALSAICGYSRPLLRFAPQLRGVLPTERSRIARQRRRRRTELDQIS